MTQHHHCAPKRFDYLLWGSLTIIALAYGLHLSSVMTSLPLSIFTTTIFELINTVWFGLVLGIISIGILGRVPREFIIKILGRGGTFTGLIRATLAGVLLDLCSHGILMVGMKLYERGASMGQVVAFLVASPWNSFSLTIILFMLIGIPWTLAFLVLSMILGITTGMLFDLLLKRKKLPSNPHSIDIPKDFHFFAEAKKGLKTANYSPRSIGSMLFEGLKGSRLVIRWILFGLILAGFVRAFVSVDQFHSFFGPTMAGLGLTIVIATILEVCSEGSTPLAADFLTRAKAPGNSFAFLMTGVSTDYTEVMSIKDTTKSWKIALFLPLLTVPQILVISWLMNL